MTREAQEMRPRLLIADDDEGVCQQLRWALEGDYSVKLAHSPAQVLATCARHQPDLILLDLNYTQTTIDGKEGVKLIQEISEKHAGVKIIVITGNQELGVARQALNAGAHDHLVKPINVEELKVLLRRACFLLYIEKENSAVGEANELAEEMEGIIAASPEMRAIFGLVERISQTDVTVLIEGESGTGKEMIARLIHHRSPRRDKKFVAINCGAIPDNLLESELFGHEKGAFTGAVSMRKGKFEIADGGTIFLDEIGELTAPLQVKLLRFLQNHVIERVGGNTPIELDVRILAATNRNLQTEILRGNFREDLYYRLNVFTIEMPPLRARGEDIDLIAHHFLKKFSAQYNKALRGFSSQALKAIHDYGWPGNVRELENKIRKAVIVARHHVILPQDLALEIRRDQARNSLRSSIEKLERELLINALRRHQGVVAHVAEELDVNRVTLYDLLRKHRINHREFKLAASK
jgi:two-component system NtrC family response regulator